MCTLLSERLHPGVIVYSSALETEAGGSSEIRQQFLMSKLDLSGNESPAYLCFYEDVIGHT
jgi:hypothetical protein